jgi:Protein of unknown function (DUF2934)
MASPATKIEPQKGVSSNPDVQPEITVTVGQAEISARAYELWRARGCPIGSPELDWLQAEEDLRMQTRSIPTAA